MTGENRVMTRKDEQYAAFGLDLIYREVVAGTGPDGTPDATAARVMTPEDIGRVVRQRREQAALSRDALSKLCDVSPTTIAALERGRPSVGIGSLMAVLGALGTGVGVGE